MAVFSNLILTDSAKDHLTQSLSGGSEIYFTKFVLSQHAYSAVEVPSLAAIQEITGQAEVSEVICANDSVTVSGLVQSSETSGYYLQTAALYASVEGNEFVYAVAIAQTADYIPAPTNGRYTSIELSFVMAVSDTSIINLTVSSTAAVTQRQFAEASTRINIAENNIEKLQRNSHTHANKTVLDRITAIDNEMSDTSVNPVQNKTMYAELEKKYDNTISRTANTVLAAPNSINGVASFRKLAVADIPDLSGRYLPLNASAVSAGKLKTARAINGVSFDGSEDIRIGLDYCYTYDASSTWSNTPWHKVASVTLNNASSNVVLVLYVDRSRTLIPGASGILRAAIRSGSTAGSFNSASLSWNYAGVNININNFVLVYTEDASTGKLTAELWVKHTAQYEAWQFKVLSMSGTATPNSTLWTLYNSSSGTDAYTAGTKVIASTLSDIQNNAQLEDSGWKTLAGDVRYRKAGYDVEVRGWYTMPSTSKSPLIGILPDGYRPSVSNTYEYTPPNGAGTYTLVDTSGNVYLQNGTFDSGTSYYVHARFFVG